MRSTSWPGVFWGIALAVGLLFPGKRVDAQTGATTISATDAAFYGCTGDLDASLEIRCCLARLDRNVFSDPTLSADDRARARVFETGLVEKLTAMGESPEPRFCPPPSSVPLILVGPSSSWPIIVAQPGPRRQPPREAAPIQIGRVSSFPRVALSFGVGTIAEGFETDVPTGAGTSQRFPAQPGASLDMRLAWLLSLAATADDPRARRLAAPVLSFYAGYTYLRCHVDQFVNVGGVFDGVVNTAFEGTTTLSRPYVGAGLSVPLHQGRRAGSAPSLALYLGANVGYSTLKLRDDAGPFRDTSDGFDIGAEIGLDIALDEHWTVRPGIEAIFNPAGSGGDPITRMQISLRYAF